MPTNRNRLRRSPQNQIVEPWMYKILLDGRKAANFREFGFSDVGVGDRPGVGKGPYWWEIWPIVKNDPIVQKWRKEHPGELCAAERWLRREGRKVDA